MNDPEQQEDLDPVERIAAGVDRLAEGLGELPRRIDVERRQGERVSQGITRMEEEFRQAGAERKSAHAERRANIAIALTAVTALSGLIAAIGTLVQG